VAPHIAPRDSFVAMFTPSRAATFIDHAHMDDMRHVAAGLYGGLVVLEPGVSA
jgi:FtsP/CotA-like multicopper oxidase with cupredoxin domain